ncbi:UPF0488 protein C8orf33 homolog [Alosa pseudoharengus]|uniref:UPF0488 protein C8orf33 homolog n=1 Tax=Alosa pseudoharengus TaxID=34774 RepID=UPI003F88E581
MTRTQGESGQGFHWTRSDNSFTFNFHPQGASPQSQNAAPVLETPPQASGFAFNFQIPAASARNTMEVAPEAVPNTEDVSQSIGAPPPSKSKKKKKKNKGEGGCSVNTAKSSGPPPEAQQESSELTPEQQLNRELDWCIEQLELGLRTQKTTPKQTEESVRALKTLRSPKAPLVKKRQVMRAVAGDYRSKMEQERDKQFKLIQSSISSARVKTVAEPARKPVFHRKAGPKVIQEHTSTQNTDAAHTQATTVPSDTTEGQPQESQGFIFKPSQEEFCFNFL